MNGEVGTIAIVAVDDDEATGEKALFGRTREALVKVSSVSSEVLSANVRELCKYVGSVFDSAEEALGTLELDSVQLQMEVTTKGEVRLIGSASAEVKGGITLVFQRRRPVT